jgi:hypothetical protein
MAYEQVDIYVEQEGIPGVPVPDVLVKVYDPLGNTFFTQSTTDDNGRAGFLLHDQEYSLRFYRFQTGFSQPQRIVVQTDPLTPGTTPNAFTVYATVFKHPVSVDSRLCRASGFFRDVTGAPRRQLYIHFIAQFRPVLLDGSLVMDERRVLKTDDNGYGCIDLIRCAQYLVTIENYEDRPRVIRVPNLPSTNLPDLLFPVVDQVVLEGVSLVVGAELELAPIVIDSAGVPFEGVAREDVVWSLADPTVASLVVSTDKLIITGLRAGSTEILVRRRDESVVRIPNTGIKGVPVTLVVA